MKFYVYVLLLTASQLVFATGLQPIKTDVSVKVQEVDFELEVRGLYVSGLMNVQFTAESGEQNAANLRFPLPTDSVLHKAEIYIPSQEKWVTAETMGRKEGEIIYDRVVEKKDDPLLIQKIGTDFYRARVFPINALGDLRMRVHYAHVLEPVNDSYQLRIAFANQDSTPSTPADGVTISLQTDADYWTAGKWQLDKAETLSPLDEVGTPSTVNLDNGTTFLKLDNFTMEADIILPLASDEPRATGLNYQSQAANLDGHLHVQWNPDFSTYQTLQQSQPRNVVFVVDISGSMTGAKLALTKQAIITSLEALDANDYFALVAFETGVHVFRPNMQKGNNIEAAIEWVSNLRTLGGTGMVAGLTTAAAIGVDSPLSDASVDLLVISDGLPNEGSSTVADILVDIGAEADVLGRQIRIFGVGIGADLDQSLLNGLAQQTGGEATFALDDNEITGQILDLFARVRGGGLTNVTVRIENMKENEFHWARMFPNTVLQIAAKGAISDQVHLILQGKLADSTPVELTTTLQPLPVENKMARIAAPLAAKAWADKLERQIDETGESSELVNQAVVLARTYGIVTRYTSLLALESDELYAEQGVELIERDPAGIALQPIKLSSVDEGRIGGQGTSDEGDSGSSKESIVSPPPVPTLAMAPPNNGMSIPSWALPAYYPSASDQNDGFPAAGYFDSGDCAVCDSNAPLISRIPSEPTEIILGGDINDDATDEEDLCENPTLDEKFQLEIAQISYQGDYYWASLKLDQGILKVLDYGKITSLVVPSTCQLEEVVLSASLQLEIPLVIHGAEQFKDVVLQGKQMDDGSLLFEIVSYT